MKPLNNAKHELFSQAVARGETQTQAAIDAGYSANTAGSQGSRLLTNDNISERILELKEAAADGTVMSIRERQQRLSEIGRANLSDYLEATPDGVIALAYDKDSPHPGAVSEVTEQLIIKDDTMEIRQKKLKLHSPIAAIHELNKMDGAHAPAKVHQTGDIILRIDSDDADL